MEVQRIKTEGPRIDPVRNVERLWLEVESAVGGGCSIEGHAVLGHVRDEKGTLVPQKTRIEVYADRLGAVLNRTRTNTHREIYQRAKESAEILTQDWIREHRKEYDGKRSQEEREKFVNLRCMHRPEHELIRMGYRTGLPPLESCKVIHPRNETTMDAFEWQKMPPEKRREWLVDAPITPQNAAQRANENLAHQIAQAIRDSRDDRKK